MADKELRLAHDVVIEKLNLLIEEKSKLLSMTRSDDISTEEGFAKAMKYKGEQIEVETKISVLMEVLTSIDVPKSAQIEVEGILKKILAS